MANAQEKLKFPHAFDLKDYIRSAPRGWITDVQKRSILTQPKRRDECGRLYVYYDPTDGQDLRGGTQSFRALQGAMERRTRRFWGMPGIQGKRQHPNNTDKDNKQRKVSRKRLAKEQRIYESSSF